MTLLPLFYQELLGYTAFAAGWAVSPRGVGAILAMPVIGILTSKVDNRWLIAGGFAMFGIASLWFGEVNLAISQWSFVWAIILSGFGSGSVFVPLSTTTMAGLPNEEIGNASGLYNLFRNVGGSIGISIVNTIVARHQQLHQNELVHSLAPTVVPFQEQLHALEQYLYVQGYAPVDAMHKAYALLAGQLDGAGASVVLRGRLPLHGAGLLRLHSHCLHAEEGGEPQRRATGRTLNGRLRRPRLNSCAIKNPPLSRRASRAIGSEIQTSCRSGKCG